MSRKNSGLRSASMALALEPRLLFDGAGAVAVADSFDAGQGAYVEPPDSDHTPAADARPSEALEQGPGSETLLIIDARVADHQSLLADLPGNVTVRVIGVEESGIAVISEALAEGGDFDAVHIVSHGSAGALSLGSDAIRNDTLAGQSEALQGWAQHLAADADILLYGCDIAQGEAGQALVTELARLTGADIAASANATGSAEQGGDWVLERQTGRIEAATLSGVGFAGLLKGSEHLTAEDRRHVDRIATGSEVLLSVINDILDYSKLEAEALEMDLQPFHVWDLAHGAGDLMEAQRAAKGLDLKIDVAASVPEALRGDAGRLRQVTLNFLSNAMKFTARGGVRLDVAGAPGPAGTWRLRVAVTDTGIGIASGKLDSLFERFTQADQSTTRNFGGTGLGLAISKRLVEAMGGEIGATSEPGAGSTFWFEVPLGIAKDAPVAPVEAVPAAERPARILVADDAPANRELVSAILGQLGIRTEVACNGVEALVAVQVADYDLVLMDMHMPEMDGLEATRSIRALGGDFLRLPIVALTANVQREQIQTCLDAGMDGHLGKPINIAELAAVVAHWLNPNVRDEPGADEAAA